ncbi:MAG: sigma-70 family RNA polymerase sigma factor [Bacteroidaceae bacterium]|nr:sigma-70 family RNA polymerase sigma factor [Bacteroidaceae bacterium]
MQARHFLITEAFNVYSSALHHYICNRINDKEEASDILQDTFVRLLDCDVICKESLKSLLFTIANNLVIDHIRRHYKRQEIYSYMYDAMKEKHALTPEQVACAKDIAEKEHQAMFRLSPAAMRVYKMTREEGMTIDEIAAELGISRRTVECHQLRGRKIVRESLRKIV